MTLQGLMRRLLLKSTNWMTSKKIQDDVPCLNIVVQTKVGDNRGKQVKNLALIKLKMQLVDLQLYNPMIISTWNVRGLNQALKN